MSTIFESLKKAKCAELSMAQKVYDNISKCLHCSFPVDDPSQVFCDYACANEHEMDNREAVVTQN